jgi:hypothetical protein
METKLPQGIDPDASVFIGNLNTTPRTIADWQAKANAYPKLVEALASTLAALERDAARETDPQMHYYATRHHESVRALLRELGEAE